MDATWAKSSFSFSNGNCVEVAELPGGSVGVRDSQDPAGPVLKFTRDGWDTFLAGAQLPDAVIVDVRNVGVEAPDPEQRGIVEQDHLPVLRYPDVHFHEVRTRVDG